MLWLMKCNNDELWADKIINLWYFFWIQKRHQGIPHHWRSTGGAGKCFAPLFISLNFLNFHNIGMYILVKLLEMKSYVMCGIEWWKVKRKKKDELCVYDNEWMTGYVELIEILLGLWNEGDELLLGLWNQAVNCYLFARCGTKIVNNYLVVEPRW